MKKRIYSILKESLGLVLFVLHIFIPNRKSKVLSIYFHNPSPKLFERVIKYLHDNSYRFISVDQFNEIIDNKLVNERSVVITIDDGWQKNLDLLEIVKKYKVYTTIFITTSAVEQGNFWWEFVEIGESLTKASMKREIIRIKKLDSKAFSLEILTLKSGAMIDRSALTKEELIQLSKGKFVTIGAHSVNHFSLPDKSYEIQKSELLDSKNTLEFLTGQRIVYFSYPGGDYNEELKKLSKECGYKLCFTTDISEIDLKRIDKYSIPRRCVNDDAGFFEALSKIHGIWYNIVK